jgi:hypothetical protein
LTEDGNKWLKLTTQAENLGLEPEILWNSNLTGIELHRIVPRRDGGKYVLENVMPVHSYCHTAWHRSNPSQTQVFSLSSEFQPLVPVLRQKFSANTTSSCVFGIRLLTKFHHCHRLRHTLCLLVSSFPALLGIVRLVEFERDLLDMPYLRRVK